MNWHSPSKQCRSSTPLGILYLALKASMPSGVSTSLANLPMEFYNTRNKNLCKKKNMNLSTPMCSRRISPLVAASIKIAK